jgi:hypothetical protein
MPGQPQMNVGEFRQAGYLQEVNRRLLHPLGLALEVTRADEAVNYVAFTDKGVENLRRLVQAALDNGLVSTVDAAELVQRCSEAARHDADEEWLSGVWDYRHDPEGIVFAEGSIDAAKAAQVTREWAIRGTARMSLLGYVVQPVPEEEVVGLA